MNEYAGREKEIEARHQKEPDEYKGAVGYPSCAGCSANWPCDAAILLAQLREARKGQGKGWLPPEAREQVRRAMEVAQSWIRSQESGDPARPSILVELATALDVLKGVE